MPKRSSKRPKDLNQLGKSIVDEITVDKTSFISSQINNNPKKRKKDPAAVALGRKGGLKGGKARAEKLTADQRSAIAKKAAEKRWES